MDNAVSQVRHMVTDFLKWEMDDRFSRDNVVIATNQLLPCGTVVGRLAAGAAQVVAGHTNVGNGAMGAVVVAVGTPPGKYTVHLLAAGATAAFEVLDPYGNQVGTGNVGTAFALAGLGFTLADGSNDFALGDMIYITVDDGGGTVAIFNPAASDGTQNAVGMVTDSYDTTVLTAPVPGAIITRNAHVIQYGLKWKSGITAAQKAAALAVLAGRGILVLREA